MTSSDSQSIVRSKPDKAIAVGLLAVVAFTGLAHGAVEAWSLAVFELAMIGLMLLWGVKIITEKRFAVRIPAAALPLAGLILLGLLQGAALTDGSGQRVSLSTDVEATRATVLALFFLLVAFVLAANFFASDDRKHLLANFLIIYGLAMAVFAIVQHFTWNGRLYWLRPVTAETAIPFGPFVNRNHFAGYMEMLMPVPIAMVITRTSRRDIHLLYLFAAAMMALAAVASLSRGGMISLAAEMAFIAGVSAKTKDEGGSRDAQGKGLLSRFSFVLRPTALVLLIAAAISAGVFWMGSERVVDRIAHSSPTGEGQREESFFTSRGWVWRDTLAMIRANPVTGVGIGAYETSYPIYSRDDGAVVLGKSYSVDRAHNDYLQILAECGVVGGALALWFIATISRAIARGLKSRDPLRRAFAIGGGAGIFGLLVHSLVDFNLQLPSNALLFLLLVAVVSPVGAVSSAARRKQERTVLPRAPVAGVATGA